MTKQLRPYQFDAVNKLRKRLKETSHPLLVNMSVGAGKSICLSELLLDMERANYKALCLTMNSTLIQQNAETYRIQGGNPGIYCAALNQKDTKPHVIFASPHSIVTNFPEINFNLIIIDEAHNINANCSETMYMRILNHYGFKAQEAERHFRVVGLTGTPYRGKGVSIIGKNQFFKEEVCNISTNYLINEGFLVKPQFGLTHVDSIDFSDCRVQNTGNFRHNDLEKAIHKDERLTGKIMKEVSTIVENRIVKNGSGGAFIFAATKQHCYECARSLPEDLTAIITGDTKHAERKSILDRARAGNLHYLISCNCLNVGVDVPNYDVCAWLRPTESLVLYTQGIGRVLRLHPGKLTSLVLDYAQNLDRHGDIDDPIINEALKPSPENEQDYCIPCYTCNTNNTVHTRRCVGIVVGKRCDHYFEFKDCPSCQIPNDITSRHCRGCEAELIDPNAKLTKSSALHTLDVLEAKYWVSTAGYTSFPVINIQYKTNDKDVFEAYFTNSEKAKNICYAKFCRHHVPNASDYYMKLTNLNVVKDMIQDKLLTPIKLVCKKDEYNRYSVVKKVFQSS